MEALARGLVALAPAVWTAAAAAYLAVFLRQDPGAERWSRRLAWAGVVLHLAAAVVLAATGHAVLASTGGLLWGMGLTVAVVYLVLEARIGTRAIGVFPMALVALLAVAGAAAGDLFLPPPENLPRVDVAVHVAAGVMSYAALLLAAVFGALYLAQRHALREHRFGLLWDRLPSLELLDEFSWRSLGAAAVFLTLLIGYGHVVNAQAALTSTYWDAKILATNALWLVTLGVSVARWTNRLRPMAGAVAALGLFALAVGNKVVVERLSGFHGGF